MGLFKKKTVTKTYDKENKKPVIKASICNGEQVVGFKDIHTGKIIEGEPDCCSDKSSGHEVLKKSRIKSGKI